jgi:hypothetical protein
MQGRRHVADASVVSYNGYVYKRMGREILVPWKLTIFLPARYIKLAQD